MKKMLLLLLCIFTFSLAAATEEELSKKYGPQPAGTGETKITLNSTEVAQLIASITWETNDKATSIGDPKAKKGGTFSWGLTGYPPTLRTEGKNSATTFNTLMGGLVYETLLSLDQVTSKYTPALADKWSIGPDKKTFFFHIDQRARWQDKTPVTAYDYVATWDLETSPDIEDPFINEYYNKFERPVAFSREILMVKTKELEWRLFLSAALMNVLPQHIIGEMTVKDYMTKFQDKMMLGSGPYKYKESRTNEFIVLERNPEWWGVSLPVNLGTCNFDQIKFFFFKDDTLIKEKFKKGELDFLYINKALDWFEDFTPDKIAAIKNNWIVRQRVFNQKPEGSGGLAYNMRTEPFSDIRVRQALYYLYNREKLNEKLFFKEYKLKDSLFPNTRYENPGNPKIRFNREKAIELLEAAGWKQESLNNDGYMVKDGKVFELDLDIYSDDTRIQTILQEDLKAVGIKLNLRQVTWPAHIKDMGERNFKIAEVNYSGTLFPNPESAYHSKWADQKNTSNIYGFKNQRVDEICELYNKEFDLDNRTKLLQELDGIITNQYILALNWYSDNSRLLFWNRFGTPEPVLSRFNDYTSALFYWWFDPDKDKALQDAMKDQKSLPALPEEVKYWEKFSKDFKIQ
ncbi:MAG: ABC transporter substrate-binding protein [Candidatus Wallbacteria bacterium]|nr:ABC transporter substrate-binding protein [Candidatus Wallbacteria bacterium]